MTTRSLLRAAGLLVWAFAGTPAALSIAERPGRISTQGLAVWIGAFVVFGVTFFRATRAAAPEGGEGTRLLLVQTLAALAMNLFVCTGFEAALLVVVAVELGLFLPLSLGLPWLAAQSIMICLLATHHMGWESGGYWSIAVIGGEAFAFTVAAMAGREAAARRALEKTNAELEATRESLAGASRDAERLRIARELHDLLGHDLIALHLELETARHLAEGKAKEPVERAHDVAKRLLADVRHAVSAGFESLPVPDALTKREIEILGMMAAGYSNREIAKACFVAEGTVKNHISNILSKLGVRDRTRAVLRALHLGLM